MIGTAEDHHSNPLKIAISKFKRDGGRFISINPIRTGYSAIADEWVPIRPGTDGALLLALIHEIIALGLYDREFLVRYTNAGQLVNLDARAPTTSACSCAATNCRPTRTALRENDRNPLWWDRITNRAGAVAHRRRRSVPLRRVHAARRAPRQARAPAARRARRRIHAGVGGRDHRHSGGDDPPARARDGRHRARREDRAADPVDRLVGHTSTRRSPATRWRSTRCAASPRIRTASRRSARSRS